MRVPLPACPAVFCSDLDASLLDKPAVAPFFRRAGSRLQPLFRVKGIRAEMVLAEFPVTSCFASNRVGDENGKLPSR